MRGAVTKSFDELAERSEANIKAERFGELCYQTLTKLAGDVRI